MGKCNQLARAVWLGLAFVCGPFVRGGITAGGDTSTQGTQFIWIGRTLNGSYSIDGGSSSNYVTAYLGENYGAAGTVGISSVGSAWNVGTLYGGYNGNGQINVEAGAKISSGGWVYLGFNPASIGQARVSGVGSTWTISGYMDVGRRGTGELTVDSGAKVTVSQSATIGSQAGSTGVITIRSVNTSCTVQDDLWIGSFGGGTLNVESGARMTNLFGRLGYRTGSSGSAVVRGAGSIWNNSTLTVGENGSGDLLLEDGGVVNSGNGYIGFQAGSSSRATVTGTGSKWIASTDLNVGYGGNGHLRIENGGQVSSDGGRIANLTGSRGAVVVAGVNALWSMTAKLTVGYSGTAILEIDQGGRVSGAGADLGSYQNSTYSVLVTGKGSEWTNGIGGIAFYRPGKLAISDHAKVSAQRISLGSSQSQIHIHVSNSDMLVVGTATQLGTWSNSGIVNLYADGHLAPGAYRPISEYAGRSMTLTGTFRAIGGTWSSSTKTFTVSTATSVGFGDVDSITTGERLVFSDVAGSQRVGVSFGTVETGVTFSASPMATPLVDSVLALLRPDQSVAAAWEFSTNYSGTGEVLLSLDVGSGVSHSDLTVWHLENGVWSQYTPSVLTVDSNGLASFTVTSFSGYAVAVPEPAVFGGAIVMGLMALRRRR